MIAVEFQRFFEMRFSERGANSIARSSDSWILTLIPNLNGTQTEFFAKKTTPKLPLLACFIRKYAFDMKQNYLAALETNH